MKKSKMIIPTMATIAIGIVATAWGDPKPVCPNTFADLTPEIIKSMPDSCKVPDDTGILNQLPSLCNMTQLWYESEGSILCRLKGDLKGTLTYFPKLQSDTTTGALFLYLEGSQKLKTIEHTKN